MKRCMVRYDTVVIPVAPKVNWADSVPDPSTLIDIKKRYVHLKLREIDGQQFMVAYDRETDTLFIKDD